jgi:hypothetical protein
MRHVEGFNQLIVTDAAGNKRILYFTLRNDAGLEAYELPPAPPAGIMDMRFSSNRLVEAPDGGIEKTIALLISSAEYPLAISWKIKEGRSSARLLIDGKDVALENDGTKRIALPTTRVELKLPSQENGLPKAFGLSQNYPNPFNPATEIHYQVAEPRFVSLRIYNIMGQEISALVQEERQPGRYSATWDGSAYPSGVYYYRMTAGEFSDTRKLLLMK